MHIDDFDYRLPEELIAQQPAEKRDGSRLLVLDRNTGKIEHRHFCNVLDYLNKGDCLVMNNSKVIPARLYGIKRQTGAKVEFLLVKRVCGDVWEIAARPGKRLKTGDAVDFSSGGTKFEAEITDGGEDGTRLARFTYEGAFLDRLEEFGKVPLPPYIKRESAPLDKSRYQTVYCKAEGSVAAPTAGLHFTEELLDMARGMGVKTAFLTLHVGIGTFRPVKCENIEDHKMHFEEYEIDEESAEIINQAKGAGGRLICVGTTSARTLESAAESDSSGKYRLKAGRGSTGIFIYPGYEFKMVSSLITNFHLPKSTLLMLVSAFYQREGVLEAYRVAVAEKYRFFSYGDAMLIL
ncbi:MAG: tRNA preQ1(34) S-adenosylmethionine ribosyltransferase-isomerase QueA [Clostridiales bacterium]|nr:tRNA preQ1(34) S-adenosylmethionine ribosyltransferase-isomerase QueA [Clostridiales bacterium]